ncbi:thermonuclease family protein [Methylopila sp. M107]|uniref:thermonuclease family protein n=1 Tax=Methylopila sp. M107 TaxID=1101190 RepID=UPI00035CF6AD|nr:thermonuclease family protein [Methylopila sp. M107]
MSFEPSAAALALAAIASPALAAPCVLGSGAEAVAVERALDGDTLALDDGRLVRLAGIAAPKAPLGVRPEDWPIGALAREGLERRTAGRVMELRLSKDRAVDRHGRMSGYLAEIEAQDHAGVAAEMLANGLAQASVDAAGRDCNATLALAEARAVDARLGLWSQPYYAVQDASDGAALAGMAGRFVVAEGRVASVRTSAGRAYINFGGRWRDALSLSLSEAALKRFGGFEAIGAKVGAELRVRGVIVARSGPMIHVTETAQILRLGGRGQ